MIPPLNLPLDSLPNLFQLPPITVQGSDPRSVPRSDSLSQDPLSQELLQSELFEPLCETAEILIERIISMGQTTPAGEWYDQPRDEWVVLLQGEAQLIYQDCGESRDESRDKDGVPRGERAIALKPGDYLLIPAHQKHRVSYTSRDPACIWLAIHGVLQ